MHCSSPRLLIRCLVPQVDASASPFSKSSTTAFRYRFDNGSVAPCSLQLPQHTPIVTVSGELAGACTPKGKGPNTFHAAAGAPALVAEIANAGHFDIAYDEVNDWLGNLVRTTAEFKCEHCKGDSCRGESHELACTAREQHRFATCSLIAPMICPTEALRHVCAAVCAAGCPPLRHSERLLRTLPRSTIGYC